MEHIVFASIVIIMLILPVSAKVVKDHQRADVDIYLSKLLNIKVDFDEFMKALLSAGREQVKVNGIFDTITTTYKYRKLIHDITMNSNVTKVTLVPEYYLNDPIIGTYVNVLNWNLIAVFKRYLHNNFHKVKDEYYQVNIPNKTKTGFLFEIEIKTRMIYVIIGFLKNLKMIPEMLKQKFSKRSVENERTSS
jgi:hypothetical protein